MAFSFTVKLSHPYMTTGKTIALTRRTFVGKVMTLLYNMISRLVITFLPRSKSNPLRLYSGSDRFKGLDLIDRVPEELWIDVYDMVQEAWIKIIPKKKECKKAKWLSEEALQIAEERREAKGKGEKERYTHLNAEFQRIARRDKKAFLSDIAKK